MCVIIAGSDKRPTLAELRACERRNPDGAGLAWLNEDGSVSFRKGISAKEMHSMIRRLPKATPFVGHFRYATVGEPSDELCHPFPIGRRTSLATSGDLAQGRRVLFHNGTWSGWRSALRGASNLPGGEWSDSRALAFALGNGSDELLDEVPCKFAVLGNNSIKLYPSDLGGWSARNGVMYSNLNWVGAIKPKAKKKGRAKRSGVTPSDLFDDSKRPKATTQARPNKPRRLGQAK